MIRFKPTDPMIAWRTAYPFADGRHGIFDGVLCHFGTSQKSTTQTSQSAPWTGQQPYLTSGFQQAGNLLSQPAPTQSNPVAPFNNTENNALSGITNLANNGTPIVPAATNFATNLENGAYLNSNPASGYFSNLAGSNLGLNNLGAAGLSNFANGTGAGQSTLNNFANGSYFGSNGSDPVAQNIMAQVIPRVGAAFNRGNAINNPAAAQTAAGAVTNALAPIEYQNYQTQEQLQQQAASTLGSQGLTGASGLESGALAGGNLQATGASGLSQGYQQTLQNMVQGNALAPQDQSLYFSNLNAALGAGQAQQAQTQAEQSGQAATQNFAQLSPYQQLQAYMQAITGGVTGGTSSTTTPYFQNNTANTLGAITGGASALAGGASAVSSLLPFLAML